MKINSCIFCNKVIDNEGSLASHSLRCKNNPKRISFRVGTGRGAKKGTIPWNKGISSVFSEQLKLWKTGVSSDTFAYSGRTCRGELKNILKSRIKEFLLEEQNHRCKVCGQIDEWNGKLFIMILDHIDGNPFNQMRGNMRLVCPICDSQSSTYKSKNNGNGRLSGKTYYREHRA